MGKKIIFNNLEINNIIHQHLDNKINCKKIGKIYGVSEWTILRTLKKHQISINSQRFVKKYSVDEKFLNKINSINSYFIGLMASDGNIKKNLNSFSLSQSGDNGLNLIEEIYKWLKYTGKIYHRKTTHKIAHSIDITSKELVQNLIKHNITPNKSFTYYYNGKALLKEFLQGYIDGDGCVGIYNSNTTKYYYISFFGNQFFKDSIINLLPIKPTCHEVNSGYFELKFFGKKGIEFSDWLWEKPIYNNSLKYNKYLLFKNSKYMNTKYYYYGKLNLKINEMINNGFSTNEITKKLNIKKRTIYNLKYNQKNGRNTY
jgi:hypothetical protein